MTEISHNERFKTIGTTTRETVDRIVSVWNRATGPDIEAGARWYDEGEHLIDQLAQQSGHDRETVAAVFAHLSPQTRWAQNIMGAQSLLLTGEAPGCIGSNVERARAAIKSADPLGTINGPKTQRFAANLLGCRERVTVDTWAVRVALGERDDAQKVLGRKGIYDAVEYAYILAGQRVGVDPVTMQATTWVVARNGRAG